MFKKVLLSLTTISLMCLYPTKVVYSQQGDKPINWVNAEMGDVIFRNMGKPFLTLQRQLINQ